MTDPPLVWVDSPPNLRRSGLGFQAVQSLPDHPQLDLEEQIADTVANLLHYAASAGHDLDDLPSLLSRGWDHFRTEALGGE